MSLIIIGLILISFLKTIWVEQLYSKIIKYNLCCLTFHIYQYTWEFFSFFFFANNLNVPKKYTTAETLRKCSHTVAIILYLFSLTTWSISQWFHTLLTWEKSEQRNLSKMLWTYKDPTYKLPYIKSPHPITLPHLVEGPIQTWIWNQAPQLYKLACFFTITIPRGETVLTF